MDTQVSGMSLSSRDFTDVKLHLLSNGVVFAPDFLDAYGPEYVEKRWAYGNSDEVRFDTRIPQEMRLGPLIAAVHYVPSSTWKLEVSGNEFILCQGEKTVAPVHFPKRPRFYNMSLRDGTPCKSVVTLYGGGSLGIFALGTCFYFRSGDNCGFCSLEPARDTLGDHLMAIKPEIAAEAVEIALQSDREVVKQVMLNGGNYRNNNNGFRRYISTLRLICEKVAQLGCQDDVEVHLIVMPPDDHALLEELRGLPIKITMNLEVFSPDLFPIIAPGKAKLYGRQSIIAALEKTVAILGSGNVYTTFVGGLEPIETLRAGLAFVSERGIAPIINVFHRDPQARLTNHPRPTVSQLREMGLALQETYRLYGWTPFYKDCGRNSLDSEAYYGSFG